MVQTSLNKIFALSYNILENKIGDFMKWNDKNNNFFTAPDRKTTQKNLQPLGMNNLKNHPMPVLLLIWKYSHIHLIQSVQI